LFLLERKRMEKVKIFVLLFDPDCKHCSGKNGDIKRIQKDSKGMNQQAQSNYKANYTLLQGDDLSVHWVPIAPSKANFKTLSQISQQSQPQATTPVGDVACSF